MRATVAAIGIALLVGLRMSPVGASVEAQTGRFVTRGPYGGSLYHIAMDPTDPSIVFAATQGGVFRSSDGGRSWSASLAASSFPWATSVAVGFSDNQAIYSTWFHDGVYRSSDGGRTWIERNDGIGSQGNAMSVAVDPTDDLVVYVGKIGEDSRRSFDGGATWERMGSLPSQYVDEIVVAPTQHQTLYAASSASGVYQSTDRGETWARVSHGIGPVYTVAVDPIDATVVYVANDRGAYRSEDGAASWTLVGEELAWTHPNLLLVDPENPQHVYISTGEEGVLRSLDSGETWESLESPGRSSSALGVDSSTSTILAGNSRSMLRSDDEGGSWRRSVLGMSGLPVTSIEAAPSAPGTIYVGTRTDGVHRSTDGGLTWRPASRGLREVDIRDLAVDATNPSIVYAATSDVESSVGLYKSMDGGRSWSPSSHGIDVLSISSVAVDPLDPLMVYATDLYRGAYRSSDGGESWTLLGLSDEEVWGISVDPSDGQVLYAAASFHVLQSLDAGASWSVILEGDYYFKVVVVDPFDTSVLYAVSDFRLYKSTDRGLTWQVLSNGIDSVYLGSFALDPSNPDLLYVGARVSIGWPPGLFRSKDGGASFSRWGRALPLRSIEALAVSSDDRSVFAGVEVGSVYVAVPP